MPIDVLDAMGKNVIVVETVGVGQNELDIADVANELLSLSWLACMGMRSGVGRRCRDDDFAVLRQQDLTGVLVGSEVVVVAVHPFATEIAGQPIPRTNFVLVDGDKAWITVSSLARICPNVIWAMDFQFDTTADGRTLKMLNIIDEFTREALAIEVGRCIDADGVVEVLDRLVLLHGAPYYVRFDNGPEFVAHAVADWCRFNSAGSLFIDPGSPWQNAWIESFNGRLRDELLNSWRFDSLLEARVIIEDWRCDYNANRPHSAHGELTPAEFALQWTTTHQPQVA